MVSTAKSLDLESKQWVKGEMIGSGSFGSVHLAMNKLNGRLFVVKSSPSRTGLESLENEANILMNLNSPYVVQYHGMEVTRGTNDEPIFNIFMEHMGGGSLADLINKFQGPLFEGAIRSYTRQILMGLNHLHENGIVHCDIKCKNILLDSFGNAKLADFGCSHKVNEFDEPKKRLNLLQCKQSIKGTPLWMAPELFKDGRLNFAIDIWSLGCTIIEMATGKPPFWGNTVNPMTLILKIVLSNEKPQFPKNFSKEGLDFLDRCFERNANKRWTAKELLSHPFVSDNKDIHMKIIKRTSVSSPLSVLDVESFDVGLSDYEDEINYSDVDESMSLSRGLMLSKYYVDEKGLEGSCLEMKTDLEASGDWFTVRSI